MFEGVLMQVGLGGSILSEGIVIAAIALVIYLIFKIGKSFMKIIFGLIANSVLGIIALYILNSVFSLGIPYAIGTVIPTVLFGLPAVGTMVILRLAGIPL